MVAKPKPKRQSSPRNKDVYNKYLRERGKQTIKERAIMNKVFYHKNCYDGITAAWVAAQALKEPELIPITYGDPIPTVSGDDEVYIVDFSFPRDVLEEMHQNAKSVLVLDHHHTARQALEGLSYCVFDMNRSGAGLAWDYFNHNKPRPALVNHVEDRDLWRFALDGTREVHAWFSSFPMSIENVGRCSEELEVDPYGARNVGAALLRYTNAKIEEVISYGTVFREVGGYSVPCVNAPYHMGSDIGHRLLELYPEAPFAGYFFFNSKGDEQWGLRGRDSDDFDVSAVAKGYGGGGHKKASGFLMNRETRG